MLKRVVLKISGQVQGVLYRVSAQENAIKLNLTGFVKNEGDGTVGIIAEGEKNDLKLFIKWCYEGSAGAKVLNIKEKWEKYRGDFDSFNIKY